MYLCFARAEGRPLRSERNEIASVIDRDPNENLGIGPILIAWRINTVHSDGPVVKAKMSTFVPIANDSVRLRRNCGAVHANYRNLYGWQLREIRLWVGIFSREILSESGKHRKHPKTLHATCVKRHPTWAGDRVQTRTGCLAARAPCYILLVYR